MAETAPGNVIDAYISAQPERAQPVLRELAALQREIAHGAEEKIKWRQPVWEGPRIYYSLTAFTNYASIMVTSGTLDEFRDEVTEAGLTATQHVIQFPYDRPLPTELVRRILQHRVHDVDVNDARWS